MPGFSLNWRRTSSTTEPAARPDGRHGDAAEQVGDEAAEDQAGDDIGVGEVERDRAHALEVRIQRRTRLVRLGGEVLQVVAVGREQHQRAETGRADRVALGDGLGGVADRVERVGRVADFLGQARHFGDAAGVVGHRAEGVERDDHAGEAEHGGHGDGRAEQAGELVGGDDAADDDDGRQRRRFERDREALDDVGAVAGDRSLRDRDDRALARAGVVLGDPDDQAGDDEADDAADEEAGAVDDDVAANRLHDRHFAEADRARGRERKADDGEQRGRPTGPCRARP